MKKENIILWLAAIVVVFVAMYISNILDKDYPITSTFGIDGKKVSYRFEKVHYGKDDFEVIIRTDIPELTGKIFWKYNHDNEWLSKKLIKSDLILSGNIPVLKPEQKINYYIELYFSEKTFILPDNQESKITLTFFGAIPNVINIIEFLLLYMGLILSLRTGLEFFNDGKKSKKFGILTAVLFLTLIALINPLYLTYKYGFINNYIPSITKLFLWNDIVVFIMWVITLIIIFRSEKYKVLPLAIAILTLIFVAVFR